MKIGLYGIQGVYNLGCEAIVRGAYAFLNKLYPNCEIVYFSYSSESDRKTLADLNIKIESVKLEKSVLKRGINKIAKTINYNKRLFLFDIDAIIDNVDIIVSIGGDIYTIPEVVRQKDRYPYYNPLVDFCDRAIKKGKKVIIYGASIGPWGNYNKAIDYNVSALRKYKLILCREKETIGYLESLGLNNTMFFPDPAFQIRNGNIREKNYIGINLSPLSLKELYGKYDEIYMSKLAGLLDKLYECTNIKLMFIPHVISINESDNDLLFLKKLQLKMEHKDNVVFADSSGGFLGIKDYISQCYVVAAARMHCAVNAIDENVPAIFLAYSQKSVGMCKYVYGNIDYLIGIKDIEKSLIAKIKLALENSDKLSYELEIRNNEIKRYYESNIDNIKKILGK